jgi:asparagine synthase (glutamine-hydrolysing)
MTRAQQGTRGIAGAVWIDASRPLSAAAIDLMLVALAHRGGAGRRCFHHEFARGAAHMPVPGVALGETCDLPDPFAARGPWSPATSEDQSVVVVLDGFLLNHATLRHRLEGAGHRLSSDGHAELLAHLYEDEGPDCFAHLEGSIAAAIWDRNHRMLVLARDRIGSKPLFCRTEQGRLLFASSLKALVDPVAVPSEVNPTALDEFLTFGFVPHPHCLWRGYQKVPPGYVAVYGDGQLSFRRYWEPDLQREDDRSPDEMRRDLRRRLESAVAARVAGREHVGVWLSSGVDSAILAALARQATDRPIHTFCVKSPTSEHDESAAAAELANVLGTKHETISLHSDTAKAFDRLEGLLDEPLEPSALFAQLAATCHAAESVNLVLTGFGADELFAGYPRHGDALTWRERLPAWLRACLGEKRASEERRRAVFDEARGRCYLRQIALFDEAERSQLYREELLAQLSGDPYDLLRTAFARSRTRDWINVVSLADLATSLPCQLLAELDAVAAAHRLECEHPFLDPQVVELAVAIPGRDKWRRGLGKRILRESFADLLPREVLRRPHRPWPQPGRTRQQLAADLLVRMPPAVQACLQADAVERLRR